MGVGWMVPVAVTPDEEKSAQRGPLRFDQILRQWGQA